MALSNISPPLVYVCLGIVGTILLSLVIISLRVRRSRRSGRGRATGAVPTGLGDLFVAGKYLREGKRTRYALLFLCLVLFPGLIWSSPGQLARAKTLDIVPTFDTTVASSSSWQKYCSFSDVSPKNIPLKYSSSGGYTGPSQQLNGRNCSGMFIWATTVASTNVNFVQDYGSTGGAVLKQCKIAVYIPNVNAGDQHTWYDFWGVEDNGHTVWLAWPGITYNQNSITSSKQGWLLLADKLTVGYKRIRVALRVQDPTTPGWYVAASGIAFSCTR